MCLELMTYRKLNGPILRLNGFPAPFVGYKKPFVSIRGVLTTVLPQRWTFMNATRGFTLIEVMVTLAIGAVLIALAIPSFRESVLNNQRASSVNQVLSALSFARAQAVARGQTVTVCRSANSHVATPTCANGRGWEEGWVTFVDSANFGVLDAGEEILRRQGALIPEDQKSLAATKKLTVRGNARVANRVSFRRSGDVSGSGTLAVCDSRSDLAEGRRIVISNIGRVRSESGVTNCNRGS